jgi:hypothetical protein
MSNNDQHRPPYVFFERRAVEDRNASISEGRYVTKDVDYIIIVPYGSEGKTKVEREYDLWLKTIRPQVGARGPEAGGYAEVNSRFDADWVQKIENMYSLWKKGEDMDVEGFPLKNWPAISPGLLRTCHDLHLLTVEQLANATDDLCQTLGMGGITWRQRARDFLEASESGVNRLSSRLAAAESENKDKDTRISSLETQLQQLQAQLATLTSKKAA